MGFLYRYIDLEDDIVKYVGIVHSKNRTLQQRLKDHHKDSWYEPNRFKIQMVDCGEMSRTDLEYLESHFIAFYETYKWFNKSKANWGCSSIIDSSKYKWVDIDEIQFRSKHSKTRSTTSKAKNTSYLAIKAEKVLNRKRLIYSISNSILSTIPMEQIPLVEDYSYYLVRHRYDELTMYMKYMNDHSVYAKFDSRIAYVTKVDTETTRITIADWFVVELKDQIESMKAEYAIALAEYIALCPDKRDEKMFAIQELHCLSNLL